MPVNNKGISYENVFNSQDNYYIIVDLPNTNGFWSGLQ